MAGLRRFWLGRLEKAARGKLESFELRDGSHFFYDPLETYGEMFEHAQDVLLGEPWPEPPQIFVKMCEAKDPQAVLERFEPVNPSRALVDVTAIYDNDTLIHERRLQPLTHEEPIEDLSSQAAHDSR